MYKPLLLKPILIGIAVGVAFFMMPFFLLRVALFFLIIGGLFRFFGNRRFHRGWHRGWRHHQGVHPEGIHPEGVHPAFTDTIRHMNEEEYKEFRQTLGGGYKPYQHQQEIPISEAK